MVTDMEMEQMQPIDMRRRIRELLSVPERDRTDAEWDELNELEIRTAPGNRDYDRPADRAPEKRQSQGGMGQGRRNDRNAKPGNKNANSNNSPPRLPQPDGRPEGRLVKRQHRRPKRQGENPQNAGAPAVPPPEAPSGGDGSGS